MPLIVPSEQEVELQALRLPGAPALSDEGLGTVAQGTGVAADEYRQAEMERIRKQNATRVLEAEAQLHDIYRAQRTTSQQRRGSSSYGVTKDIAGWWESEPSKIMATLENSTQRELFNESVVRSRDASLDEFSTFESRETHAGAVDAGNATITRGVDIGAAGFDNPSSVALAREEIETGLSTLSVLNRWNQDQYDHARVDAYTKLHQQIIENMVDADPAAASAYFQSHKDEIAGSVHDQLQAKIRSTTDIRIAQDKADEIWDRGLSSDAAYAAARKELEGPSREQALTLLRQQYADQEASTNDHRRNVVEDARADFEEGGYRALSPNQIDTLSRVAPNELRAMQMTTPQDQVVTNWDVYDGLLELSRKERTTFIEDTDLLMFRADLNSVQLAELQKIQDDYREGRASPTATLTQIIGEVGFENREQEGAFSNSVREAILVEQNNTGVPPTEFRMREIVNEQLTRVTVPDGGWFWFDSTAPVFEATAEQFQAIPQEDRDELAADFRRARGRAPTEAEVVRIYNRYATTQQQQQESEE